ncbi:MAG: cobalamin biosynthesis protein [Desulfocapsaceae bacterium]|jgi:cobalt-precorrin 5A hydrolase|nr:cobalamin biosynthesis protein [Desulfocapsaceae bacterium]
MKLAIVAITEQGRVTAGRLHSALPGSTLFQYSHGIKKQISKLWQHYDGIICVMAAGIVVRCISPLCRSKLTDPAIVVVDEQCTFAISLLSGHIGGANRIALEIEKSCGARAVITTASDISGHTSVDLWARDNALIIANPEKLAAVSARLLNRGLLSIYQDYPYQNVFPEDFRKSSERSTADIIVSVNNSVEGACLHLVPQVLSVGFGCRRGAAVSDFDDALKDITSRYDIHVGAIANIASIDLKNDEAGLLEFAEKHHWPVKFFTKEQINAICPAGVNTHIFNKVGVYGVCEPAAILAATHKEIPGRLLIGKIKWQKITAAIAAQEPFMWSEPAPGPLIT